MAALQQLQGFSGPLHDLYISRCYRLSPALPPAVHPSDSGPYHPRLVAENDRGTQEAVLRGDLDALTALDQKNRSIVAHHNATGANWPIDYITCLVAERGGVDRNYNLATRDYFRGRDLVVNLDEVPREARPEGDDLWHHLLEAQLAWEIEVYKFGKGAEEYAVLFLDEGHIVPLRHGNNPGMTYDDHLGVVPLMEVSEAAGQLVYRLCLYRQLRSQIRR